VRRRKRLAFDDDQKQNKSQERKKTAERFSFKNTSMDTFQTSIIRKYSLYTTNGKAQTDSLATKKQVSLTLEKYIFHLF